MTEKSSQERQKSPKKLILPAELGGEVQDYEKSANRHRKNRRVDNCTRSIHA